MLNIYLVMCSLPVMGSLPVTCLGITVEEQDSILKRMENVILRLLMKHPKLCYYQGLHDVTLTFLLVLQEEDMTFSVMDTLVQYHLRSGWEWMGQ